MPVALSVVATAGALSSDAVGRALLPESAIAETLRPVQASVLARTPTVSLAQIEAILESLGAQPAGRWRMACTYMLPRAADAGLHELFDVQPDGPTGERLLVSRTQASLPQPDHGDC